MKPNPNTSPAPQRQGKAPAGRAQERDCPDPEKAGHPSLIEKVVQAEKEALEWLSTMAVKGECIVRLSPSQRAAIDTLTCLSDKLCHLNHQAEREGLRSVEPACVRLLDEILRQLAVLNSPETEGKQA